MELTVLKNVQELTWNFDEVKAKLTSDIEKYAGLVVSETNLVDMERTQREIGKLRTTLQKFRLAVKKDLEKPYNAFELQVKELAALVESAERPIKDQIEKYEEKRKELKTATIQNMIIEISTELGLGESYQKQICVASKYLNKGEQLSDIKTDIQTKVCWFLDVQAKDVAEVANRVEKINMAKMMCELLGRDLITPYSFADVENKIESLNITELRTYIENQVAVRKEREETAASVALEREEQKRIQEVKRLELVEQAKIAEVERQRRIEDAHEAQLAHVVEMAKVETPVKPIKLYNADFYFCNITDGEFEQLKTILDKNKIEFKYSVKVVL